LQRQLNRYDIILLDADQEFPMIFQSHNHQIHVWLKRPINYILRLIAHKPEKMVAGLALMILLFLSACGSASTFNGAPQPTSPPLGGSSSQSPGVVWERSGGIAGMCQKLTLQANGSYLLENCRDGTQIAKGTLSADQLDTLNGYLSQYSKIQWSSTAPAGSADMFVDQYTLYGSGGQTPSPSEETAINEFLANLAGQLASSSSTSAAGNETSGIEGQVLLGPACPGPVSVDKPCPDKPYQATILVKDQNGKTITQFQCDPNGKFRVSLSPGTYTLHPESSGAYPRAADQTVAVKPGQFTQVQITYDSGIR
jgi:hypothetical protein